MEAERIFYEVIESDEMQTLFGMSKESLTNESWSETSNNHVIEYIKDIINGVEHRRSDMSIYQGLLKKKPNK